MLFPNLHKALLGKPFYMNLSTVYHIGIKIILMKTIKYLFPVLIIVLSIPIVKAQTQSCNTGKVDPKVAAFLKMIPADNRSLEEVKKTTNFVEYKKDGPPPIPYPVTDVERIKITADSIPVLIFNPSHRKGLPIIIAYHGGGFIGPLIPGHEYLNWQDSKTFTAIVFSVDYRVAPEHKFPAGADDCYNAFKWISENGDKFGGDTSRIMLKGESAGANLVAVVCQKAKREGIARRIKLQVMNSPVVDNPEHAEQYPSMQQNANGYLLTKAGVLFALETYSDSADFNNSDYAPILSKDLKGLPPAVMITAEFDPLRDQGAAYAERLKEESVKVWYKCFPGEIHVLIGADEKVIKDADQLILTAMKAVMKF
jgi:acetyl esterase